MSILIIRHPETEWTARRLFQGTKEGAITINGAKQAQAFVSTLHFPVVHHIYHAPNYRTEFLANLLSDRYRQAEVYMDPRLQERSFGIHEGVRMSDVNRNEGTEPQDLLDRYLWKPKGGESYQEISDRVNDFIHELRQAHAPEEVVICITSGGVIRNILHVQHGLSLAEVFKLDVPCLEMHEIPHQL